LINGVLPIVSMMPFCTCMGPPVLESSVHSKARTGRQFGYAPLRGPMLAMQRAEGVRCAFCPMLYQFRRAKHGRENEQGNRG
jgi:hypothetical protein